MNWIFISLRKCATFRGRSRRTEYWYFSIFYCFFSLAMGSLIQILHKHNVGGTSFIPLLLLPITLATFSLGVRRLHDIGLSGWWFLLGLIPLFIKNAQPKGSLWVLVLLVQSVVFLFVAAKDSQPGENAYGPNPKDVI